MRTVAFVTDRLPAIRAATRAPIVAFGPHVDRARFADARRSGADATLARSRLLRDPAAAVTEALAAPRAVRPDSPDASGPATAEPDR